MIIIIIIIMIINHLISTITAIVRTRPAAPGRARAREAGAPDIDGRDPAVAGDPGVAGDLGYTMLGYDIVLSLLAF